MREPLFTPNNDWLLQEGDRSNPEIQQRAALHRAIGLAIESAFTYGLDLPVGAVVLERGAIIGRGFANDSRFGYSHLHAEQMALHDSQFTDFSSGKPDTVVVTIEPCGNCQDMLANIPSLSRVAFGISRVEVADMGLVNPKEEDIFDRVNRYGHTYRVVQVEDEALRAAGLTVLSNVHRDQETGDVEVDRVSLHNALVALNEAGSTSTA